MPVDNSSTVARRAADLLRLGRRTRERRQLGTHLRQRLRHHDAKRHLVEARPQRGHLVGRDGCCRQLVHAGAEQGKLVHRHRTARQLLQRSAKRRKLVRRHRARRQVVYGGAQGGKLLHLGRRTRERRQLGTHLRQRLRHHDAKRHLVEARRNAAISSAGTDAAASSSTRARSKASSSTDTVRLDNSSSETRSDASSSAGTVPVARSSTVARRAASSPPGRRTRERRQLGTHLGQRLRHDDAKRHLVEARLQHRQIVHGGGAHRELVDGRVQDRNLVSRRRSDGQCRDLCTKLLELFRSDDPRGQLVDPLAQAGEILGGSGVGGRAFERRSQLGKPCLQPALERLHGGKLAQPLLDGIEPGGRLLHALAQLVQRGAECIQLRWIDTGRSLGDTLLDRRDRGAHVVPEQPQVLVPRGRCGHALDGSHALLQLLQGAAQVDGDVRGAGRRHGSAVLPRLGCDGLGRAQLLEGRPLLGESARQVEPGEAPLPDEHLPEPRAGLALHVERPVEVVAGDEATLQEDLPDRAPQLRLDGRGGRIGRAVGVHVRRRVGRRLPDGRSGLLFARLAVALELGPLLREHARELEAGDAELRNDDLAQPLAARLLLLQGKLELFLRDEPLLDEEGADQARRHGRGRFHIASIGRHPFEV